MAKFSHLYKLSINHKGHWITNEITLHEIDTDIPIEEQLEKLDGPITMTSQYLLSKLDANLENTLKQMDGEK